MRAVRSENSEIFKYLSTYLRRGNMGRVGAVDIRADQRCQTRAGP